MFKLDYTFVSNSLTSREEPRELCLWDRGGIESVFVFIFWYSVQCNPGCCGSFSAVLEQIVGEIEERTAHRDKTTLVLN